MLLFYSGADSDSLATGKGLLVGMLQQQIRIVLTGDPVGQVANREHHLGRLPAPPLIPCLVESPIGNDRHRSTVVFLNVVGPVELRIPE
jgi:hypothetical protein